MDWENERYVRLYTRSTVDDSVLSWQARALWHELLRKFDRSGVIDLGRHGTKGISALVGIPSDVVTGALLELAEDGRVGFNEEGTRLLAPNFLEAQEAKQSDKLRQARSRESRRALSQNVTECHDSSHGVTSGHTVSQPVTPSLAVPSLAKLTGGAGRAHRIPKEWKPNDKHIAKARKLGLDAEDEADTFRNHADSKGRTLLSWDAGFHNWLKSSAKRKAPTSNYPALERL